MIWYRDLEKLTSTSIGICQAIWVCVVHSLSQWLLKLSVSIFFLHRGMMMNGIEGIGNVYGAPMGYGVVAPLSGTTTATETLVPMYGSVMMEAFPAETAAIMSDSDWLYIVPVSRKCSRDAINSSQQNVAVLNNRNGFLTFLGEDFSFQFQHGQLEIDRFIAQHTEKERLEVEERRKRYSQRSRDLAQTNEATTNALRCNLEQVLAQVQDEQQQHDDAQSSCCGSNFDETAVQRDGGDDDDGCIGPSNRDRSMCMSCGRNIGEV
ncbi:hypothetical protein PHJA_002154900 [Phtheirospermum japonicum]|uniref:Uncharacterized protein n=1 Tax=Phtheirospermum japonicum TaxID=374723 RepID=A0A830CRA0_9LAMI|nr:hypothetical protein PHJA_002154900 [Phtheirospermum japonicum]